MKTIQEVVKGMLTENTGCHILDSGGSSGYGRHFERNQVRDFENEKPCTVDFSHGYIDFKINIYHWLSGILETSELNDVFHNEFIRAIDSDGESWLSLMERFTDWLEETGRYSSINGFYGEGEPITVNTYNEECLLDQTLQFKYFTCEDGEFVILQIHGGADVRGGYTEPKVFEIDSRYDELAIFNYRNATIVCTGKDHFPGSNTDTNNDGHYWQTDDGNHWYREGTCGLGAGTQLESYTFIEIDGEDKEWEKGYLFVKDGVGYCPECGGKLEGSV